jgi:hypothetical protein
MGNSFQPCGLQLYISCNRNLWLIGQPSIATAPAQKPSFPSIIGGACYVHNDHIYGMYAIVTVTAGAFALADNLQLSATKGLSTGVTFVGESYYRNLGTLDETGSDSVIWGPTQFAPVGNIAVGQQCGLRIRLVDPATGYAGAAERALCTVTYV